MYDSVTVTTDQRETVKNLIRSLPGILTGSKEDQFNIGSGFRTRIGYTILSQIGPNFENLGRGESGVDGDRWPRLSPEYLAYGKKFGDGVEASLKRSAGLSSGNRFAPGNKKGLLSADQLKLWRSTYSRFLGFYASRGNINDAKAHAAAVAWIVVKAAGGKTKLEVYGNRQVQMLVDTGRLRGSLQPGEIWEIETDAMYQKPGVLGGVEQEFDVQIPTRVVVGTNVEYAKYHHNSKRKMRRFWPKTFPSQWWEEVFDKCLSGLIQIKAILARGDLR